MIGLMWGRRVLIWSLPGVCFLAFMIPVPFQLEMLANESLQWASAWCSCFLLGLTSTFAATDGYTLRMAAGQVGITADCSGLRMTVAIAALCYVITFLNQHQSGGVRWTASVDATPTRRSSDSLQSMALHLCAMMLLVIPAAIVANAARIAVMALVLSRYRVESWTAWAHDLDDWFVLPVAAALFLIFRAWLGRVLHIWRTEIDLRRSSQHGSYIRRHWMVRISPVLRIAVAPFIVVVLTDASIRHYHVQRDHVAAEMMTAGRGHEATADWTRAAACYRDLVYLQPSAQEARFRHAWVSGQAATTLTGRKQVFFQLEEILDRAPFHVATLRTHLDLALELDTAAAAIRSAERLYSIDRHEATTLQMCVEAMLRFPADDSGLPVLSAEILSELAENFGPASQWRDNLVIELAAFCCRHADSVDSGLTDSIGSAVTQSAREVGSAHAFFQAWHFNRVFAQGAASLELALSCIDDKCPKNVAYDIYVAAAEEAWGGRKPDDAHQFLTKAIALKPNDHRGYALLGDVHEAQQDWTQCSAARLRAWRLVGDRPLELGVKLAESLIRTERHPTLTPLVKSLVEVVNYPVVTHGKTLQVRLHLVETWLHIRAARHAEALQKLKYCHSLATGIRDQSELRNRMLQNIETLQAQCLVQLGRYSDIARLFEERAGRVDSSPDQWTAAARAWRTANNASAASRCYRNAIFRLGSYSEVWLEYVHLLKVTSGIDEAAGEVAYRDRHADQEPPIADTVLAQAWEIVGQSDRAITHYRSAAKRNAHDVAALAIALARQGRTQDAGCGRTCRRRTMDRQYVDSRPYGRHGGCLCGRSVSRIQRNHHADRRRRRDCSSR
ncbi:MAG: archaeosortase/exosortase family protein [Fuerstiella sp.]